MKDLIISIDATGDLTKELEEKYNICHVDMEFFVGEDQYNTKDDDVVSSKIYERMRKGERTSTSQINEALYEEYFSKLIKENKSIIHITLSSGLSGTYNSAVAVAERFNNDGANIKIVDSIGGSSGQGLLAMLARDFAENAETVDEVVEYLETTKMNFSYHFTVDNLKYLAQGGRISGAAAIVGNLLSIKPIIKADDNGKLFSFMKVISRKKALKTLVNLFKENVKEGTKYCFVSHADAEADALQIKSMIEEFSKVEVILTNIGPVMGSHCGPGTVALFYESTKK